jgi:TolA-binding protein
MNRAALLGAITLSLAAPLARAQTSTTVDSGQEEQREVAEVSTQTAQRISDLEARVEALEAQPGARDEARNARSARSKEIIERLVVLERTLALGQQDVSASLKDAQAAVSALSDSAAAEGSRTEAMRASEALQAVDYALEAVGREDLYQARSALTRAVHALAVARDLATAG